MWPAKSPVVLPTGIPVAVHKYPVYRTTITFDAGSVSPGDRVTVAVRTENTEARLYRTVPSDCVPEGPEIGVRFVGARAGNAFLERARGTNATLEVTYWLLVDGDLEAETATLRVSSTTVNLQAEVGGVGPEGFVAVYLPATDTTYVHPALDYDGESWSTGTGEGSDAVTGRECSGRVDFEASPGRAVTCGG